MFSMHASPLVSAPPRGGLGVRNTRRITPGTPKIGFSCGKTHRSLFSARQILIQCHTDPHSMPHIFSLNVFNAARVLSTDFTKAATKLAAHVGAYIKRQTQKLGFKNCLTLRAQRQSPVAVAIVAPRMYPRPLK